MYVFNGDGTMQQANPDAGDPHTSDSDGEGVWVADGNRIRGKWMEVLADRSTHQFSGRLEISFELYVEGNTLSGTESVRSFDENGKESGRIPTPSQLHGTRVTTS
jgi:hypothetical protein